MIGKLVKSVGKAAAGAVKGVAKVANKVFSSKIFNIATTAMCFIPGLNAAGVIGKGLSVLGKASTIQKWIKTGMNVFNALKNGKGLTDVVKNLMSGKFQPLGLLSNLPGAGGALGTLANGLKIANQLQNKLSMFQEGASLLKQVHQLAGNYNGLAQQLLPTGWSALTSGLESMQSPFLRHVEDFHCRIQSTAGMFQELQKLLNPHPLQGNDFIVRA